MRQATITYVRILAMTVLLLFFLNRQKACSQKRTYTVQYQLRDKDNPDTHQMPSLQTDFEHRDNARKYVEGLDKLLFQDGFAAASVDSVSFDSTHAEVALYLGKKYKWAAIHTDSLDPIMLEAVGWNGREFKNKQLNFPELQSAEQKMLTYYEDNGYPFASVSLQQIDLADKGLSGTLKVDKGPFYHIDSIRLYGKAKIKNLYLQHYLDIYNGSVYDNEKLKKISNRLQQLPFLQEQQPWDISMLGSGATLNLYLQPKRSSQINVLVGFVPASTITGKSQLTADVHLDLKNSFGSGESILLNWQQLQPQSPRLNLGYSIPYVLKSNFGFNFSFDLLKKDSSYLQLNGIMGVKYLISATKTFGLFYQIEDDYLLAGGVDTFQVIQNRKLPSNIDVRSGNIGLAYHFANTNYLLNPRKGNELDVTATAGIKKTSKNNDILNLKDPADPSFNFATLYDSIKPRTYRFKFVASAAHYFPLGKESTFRTAASTGWIESPQKFQNELFRLGGYALLRGFDEESIYADRYAVFTAEYRYLLGTNSYFSGFSDLGLTHTGFAETSYSNLFISAGVGLQFETRFGLLNLSYAAGKRNDVKFDLRNSSKIHFGYINYF